MCRKFAVSNDHYWHVGIPRFWSSKTFHGQQSTAIYCMRFFKCKNCSSQNLAALHVFSILRWVLEHVCYFARLALSLTPFYIARMIIILLSWWVVWCARKCYVLLLIFLRTAPQRNATMRNGTSFLVMIERASSQQKTQKFNSWNCCLLHSRKKRREEKKNTTMPWLSHIFQHQKPTSFHAQSSQHTTTKLNCS